MAKNNFDQEEYRAWVKKIESQIPTAFVPCPDCNGTGEGTCPHCGNDIDCEECGGDGKVSPSRLLTVSFYLRVMELEKSMLEHWVKWDPIPTKDERGRVVERHNPLNEIIQEVSHPFNPYSESTPKIVLRLPLTEKESS